MPAASILPVSLYKGKLYFLFGKENPMEDSAKGFSDFGGGMEPGEKAFDAALREGSEELTGFLGTKDDIRKRLKKTGVYTIVHPFVDRPEDTYTVHLFPISYSNEIVEYFNNNHAFLWNKMNKTTLNKSKLFEKIRVEWFCEDDLQKRESEYRPFYREIVQDIVDHKKKLRQFMKRSSRKTARVYPSHNTTRRYSIVGGR